MEKQAITQRLQAIHDAFNAGNNAALEACYTKDAKIVPKPLGNNLGTNSVLDNVEEFREKYATDYIVSQGNEVVLEAGDVALVMTNLYLSQRSNPELLPCEPVKAVYVFKKHVTGEWHCAVDNFFGVDLLTYS
jgi:ketosteroid isomerase-like protein